MQDTRYQPNPLRPYYIPPTIGRESSNIPNATTSSQTQASSFSFPDIDYTDYIPDASPSMTSSAKKILDQAVWKYSSVLMAQPFEVAKLILQTRVAQDDEDLNQSPPRETLQEEGPVGEYDDDDEEEPNYFTSAAPLEESRGSTTPRGRKGRPTTARTGKLDDQQSPERLRFKHPHSLLDALSALSQSGGAFAMWRGTNSTFIYSILSRTLETFFRGFFSATFGLAENDMIFTTSGVISDSSILASSSPGSTLLIVAATSALTALILAPIDAARTRLILTPSDQEPRSLLSTVRTLSPSWLIPAHLTPITFLISTIPTLISTSTPLFLKSYFGLDPTANPVPWSIATFCSSACDLAVRFPLETVLRRAQIATWTASSVASPASSSKRKALKTIVPVPQSYRGILPTVWEIMREEGYSESQKDRTAALMGKAPRRRRKGQGIEGLYRGWRVGLWALVGIWGTSFVGGLASGVESSSGPAGAHGGKF